MGLNPHNESPYFHMGYCFFGVFSDNSLLSPPGSENISKSCFKGTKCWRTKRFALNPPHSEVVSLTSLAVPAPRDKILHFMLSCAFYSSSEQPQSSSWLKSDVAWSLFVPRSMSRLHLEPRSLLCPDKCCFSSKKDNTNCGESLVKGQIPSACGP